MARRDESAKHLAKLSEDMAAIRVVMESMGETQRAIGRWVPRAVWGMAWMTLVMINLEVIPATKAIQETATMVRKLMR